MAYDLHCQIYASDCWYISTQAIHKYYKIKIKQELRVIDFKLSLLRLAREKPNLSKAAAIALVIPILAMSMTTAAKAETVKKSDSKTTKTNTSTAQNLPSSENRIAALDEMTVSDKQSPIDSWLTEESDAVPVQKRTELGKLTKTAPIAGSILDQQELKTVKHVDILRDQLNRIPGLSMVRNMRIPDSSKPTRVC
jgi:hypothetical protein